MSLLRRLIARLARPVSSPDLAASAGSAEPWDLLEARQQVDAILGDGSWRTPPVGERRIG